MNAVKPPSPLAVETAKRVMHATMTEAGLVGVAVLIDSALAEQRERDAKVAEAKSEEYRLAFERCDEDGRNASRESWMLKDKMTACKEVAAAIREGE